MTYVLPWHSVRFALYYSYFYYVCMTREETTMISYIFSNIDPCVLCFILGLTVGVFAELILVLIIEKIGGKLND